MLRKAAILGIISTLLFFVVEWITNHWLLEIKVAINLQFVVILCFYIIFGAFLGLVAFIAEKIVAKFYRKKLDTKSFYLSFLISAIAFLYYFVWINNKLPTALFSFLGLVINIGLIFGCTIASLAIYIVYKKLLKNKYRQPCLDVSFIFFFCFVIVYLLMFNYEAKSIAVQRLTNFWSIDLIFSNLGILLKGLLFSSIIYFLLLGMVNLKAYLKRVTILKAISGVSIILFIFFLALFISDNRRQQEGVSGDTGKFNVIFILADAMRADHMGFLGYSRPTTPNLDRLAGVSTVFDSCFAQNPSTGPTILTLFTSRYFTYPYEKKGKFIKSAINNSARFIELLNKRDYRTGVFTAYNISSKLLKHHNFSYSYADPQFIYGSFFVTGLYGNILEKIKGITYLKILVQEKMVKDLFNWLQVNREKRFMAYIHLVYSHSPYKIPDSYEKKFYKGTKAESQDLAVEWQEEQNKIDPNNISKIVDMYDDSVNYTDKEIGRILKFLKENGFYENTVVVVFADHGEVFLEHNDSHHGRSLFDENIHIPLIFYVPGLKSRVSSQLVGSIDIMPTVMDLIDVDYPGELCDGLSMRLLLEGEKSKKPLREYIFSQRTGYFTGIRTDKWKLIFCEEGREKFLGTTKLAHREMKELYDLKSDPEELKNIYDLKKDDPEIRRLIELLEEHIEYQDQLSQQIKDKF